MRAAEHSDEENRRFAPAGMPAAERGHTAAECMSLRCALHRWECNLNGDLTGAADVNTQARPGAVAG